MINAKALRHPIIERLNPTTEYVSNDIAIGGAKKGLLLYGINASGKSSLMKSVGLNIIMAQSGMFVAASTCELVPYHHLFTRISGADNIYRGLSTFTIEMLELKNILNRCDEHSLILGDELCAGTESVSAIAIVAAGIEHLLHNRSTFIFATHLHELLDVDFIKEHSELDIQHLHISMDETTGKIRYDRTLKAGNGSKIYGLEVCRFLKMSDRFLQKANLVRKAVMAIPSHFVEAKPSKYNSEMYVDACAICGAAGSETHHIRQQKDADANGFVGDVHKDARSNLIVLCERCHLAEHHGTSKIEKTVMTSDGVEYVRSQPEAASPGDEPVDYDAIKPFLHYSANGWKYRHSVEQAWKKLTPVTYETVFAKVRKKCEAVLPLEKADIDEWLKDNQSEFLVFA
jgi:DNA mismatch repair protein MutS